MADGSNILPFPGKVVPFRPARATEETVWQSGGSLHAKYGGHVRHLDVEDALTRRAFWADEAARLGYDPTSDACRHAVRRWSELTRALDDLDRWNRVVGRPSPYPDPQAEVSGRPAVAVGGDDQPEPPEAA